MGPVLPGINARTLRQREAAGMRGPMRAGRILQSWRRRRHCGNRQRSLGSSCRWARSSWSWWRLRSPEVYRPVWMNRRQGRTAWLRSRSRSLRWRDASCRSSWAACETLQRQHEEKSNPQLYHDSNEWMLCLTSVFILPKVLKFADSWVKMLIGVLSVLIIRVLTESVLTDLCCRQWRLRGERHVFEVMFDLTWHLDKWRRSGRSCLWNKNDTKNDSGIVNDILITRECEDFWGGLEYQADRVKWFVIC